MIFIRIKVRGNLNNITENELYEFEEKGIRNNNKIIYSGDGVKNTIKIGFNEVILIREGSDFVNTFVFNKGHSSCNYYLKDNNYDVDIDINTTSLDVSESCISIGYVIVDSGNEYEYRLEMSDV